MGYGSLMMGFGILLLGVFFLVMFLEGKKGNTINVMAAVVPLTFIFFGVTIHLLGM